MDNVSRGIFFKVPDNNSYYGLGLTGSFDAYSEDPLDSNRYAGIYISPALIDIYLSPTSEFSLSGIAEESNTANLTHVYTESTSGKLQKLPLSQVISTSSTAVSNNEDDAIPDGVGGWGVPLAFKIIVPPKTIVKFDFFARFFDASTDGRFATKFALYAGLPGDAQENVSMKLIQEDSSVIERVVLGDLFYTDLSWDAIAGYNSDTQKLLIMTGTLINYNPTTTHEWQFEYRSYDGYLGQKYKLAPGGSLTYQNIGTVL